MNYIEHAFALIGVVSIFLLGLGIALDISDFDNTRGGYSAPYDDFTGVPVDWSQLDITPVGLVKRGYVINVHVNGTTGMISMEFFGKLINFRPFSDRALVVHQPRKALKALGFIPEF